MQHLVRSCVTRTNFSNYKVQKYDASHQHNYQPCEPENFVFKLIEMNRVLKVEVGKGESDHSKELYEEFRQAVVLMVGIPFFQRYIMQFRI